MNLMKPPWRLLASRKTRNDASNWYESGPASFEMINPAVQHRQFKEKREGAW